jgi:hypothetical protein
MSYAETSLTSEPGDCAGAVVAWLGKSSTTSSAANPAASSATSAVLAVFDRIDIQFLLGRL